MEDAIAPYELTSSHSFPTSFTPSDQFSPLPTQTSRLGYCTVLGSLENLKLTSRLIGVTPNSVTPALALDLFC